MISPNRPRSPLSDLELKKKLEKAAKAAGMSLEELREIAQLSGETSMTQFRGTLDDCGADLYAAYRDMRDTGGDPVEFFKGLEDLQQVVLLVWLVDNGHAPLRLAREFGVSEQKIRQSWALYARQLGSSIRTMSADVIIGTLQARSETLYELLMQSGDIQNAWRVTRDTVFLMQRLGVVVDADREHEREMAELKDNAQVEINRMVDLKFKEEKNKRLAKAEEAEVIGANE